MIGAPVALALRLPDGGDLHTRATVAYLNDAGMGVRFQLEPAEEARLYAAIVQLTARPRRALVVDDDALHRQMLGDALLARGFEVVTAADGAAGVRALADEPHARPPPHGRLHARDGRRGVRADHPRGGRRDRARGGGRDRPPTPSSPRLLAAGADGVLEKALGAEKVAEAADGVWTPSGSERARARHQERVRRGRGAIRDRDRVGGVRRHRRAQLLAAPGDHHGAPAGRQTFVEPLRGEGHVHGSPSGSTTKFARVPLIPKIFHLLSMQ